MTRSRYSIERYEAEHDRLLGLWLGLACSSDPTEHATYFVSTKELQGDSQGVVRKCPLPSTVPPREVSSGGTGSSLPVRTNRPLPPATECPSLSSVCSSVDDVAGLREELLRGLASPSDATSEAASDPPDDAPKSQDDTLFQSPSPQSDSTKPGRAEPGRTEPALYNAIQTILASDPQYASLLISAIEGLPQYKQDILHGDHPPSDGAGITSPSSSGQASSDNDASTGSSSSPSNNSNQSAVPPEAQQGQDPDDEGDGKDGGGPRPPLTRQRKPGEVRQWICPFCHAFRSDRIPRFKTCRPFGNLKERKHWSEHLKNLHSPRAAREDNERSAHSLYYMSEDTWEKVQRVIKKASDYRPRDSTKKLTRDTKCFFDIWALIFPKTVHPTLKKPSSPFWSVQPAHHVIEDRLQVMLEAIFSARAEKVVQEGAIASKDDFRPDRQESMDMSKTALTILATMSETMSRAVVNSTDESIQAAVAAHFDSSREETSSPADLQGEEQRDREPANSLAATENVAVIALPDAELHLRLVPTDRKSGMRLAVPPGSILKPLSQDGFRRPIIHNDEEAALPQSRALNMASLDAATFPFDHLGSFPFDQDSQALGGTDHPQTLENLQHTVNPEWLINDTTVQPSDLEWLGSGW